ncbi:MAG: PepSY domain-containing protein [Deferrisomatales bacterium]
MSRRAPSALLRRSRALHRWMGLLGLLYFAAMAVSGVLLNHAGLLAGLDLPRAWLPGDYAYRDWNRNSLRGTVPGPGRVLHLYGEAGVWWWEPGAAEPVPDAEGFERSVYYRDTRAVLRVDGSQPYLLAGTRGGLWGRPAAGGPWRPVPLAPGNGRETVVDLLEADGALLAVTRDRVYRGDTAWPPAFVDATPARAADPERRLPLFRLIFELHSGGVWGLPGRLAMDALGVLLAFLCLTGAWFWWRKRRRTLARGVGGRWARKGLGWHLRLGLWVSPLLLLVAATGFFQRPPFLIAVAFTEYPERFHPAPSDPNPWHDLLRKAAYDPVRRTLLLATADGFYSGPADGSRPFERAWGGPPVSVMGATVLRRAPDGLLWVGSMSGLYVWDRASGWVTDAFTGRPPRPGQGGPVGQQQVVGWVGVPDGRVLVADYGLGLVDGEGQPQAAARVLPMPRELREGGRISLWHALFELHNGRLFSFLLGWWTWVVVPVGGLALVTQVATGVLDRWVPRRRSRRQAA